MPAALFHGQFWEDPSVEAPAAVADAPQTGFGFVPGMIILPKKKLTYRVREVKEPEAEYLDDDELEALLQL